MHLNNVINNHHHLSPLFHHYVTVVSLLLYSRLFMLCIKSVQINHMLFIVKTGKIKMLQWSDVNHLLKLNYLQNEVKNKYLFLFSSIFPLIQPDLLYQSNCTFMCLLTYFIKATQPYQKNFLTIDRFSHPYLNVCLCIILE